VTITFPFFAPQQGILKEPDGANSTALDRRRASSEQTFYRWKASKSHGSCRPAVAPDLCPGRLTQGPSEQRTEHPGAFRAVGKRAKRLKSAREGL